MAQDKDPPLQAVVVRVIEGPRPYAITRLVEGNFVAGMDSRESVTFALAAWTGAAKPLSDQVVLLSGVQLFKRGWRATSVSPIQLQQHKGKDQGDQESITR
jgi:hypothetical protein